MSLLSRSLWIFFFGLIVLSLPARAHGDHGLSGAEAEALFDRVLQKFSEAEVANENAVPAEELGHFEWQGEKIPYRRSAMMAALGDLNSLLRLEHAMHCTHDHGHCEHEAPKRFYQRGPVGFAWNVVSYPPKFFFDLLWNSPAHLKHGSGYMQRTWRSHGPALLSVIVLTQIAWEGLESVLSWSLGMGGAHAACMTFNIALLTVVDGLKSTYQSLSCAGTQVSPNERARISRQRIWTELRVVSKLIKASRMPVNAAGVSGPVSAEHLPKSHVAFEELLLNQGFAASLFASYAQRSFQGTHPLNDFALIFSDAPVGERHFIATANIRGLRVLDELFRARLAQARPQMGLWRYWKIERAYGSVLGALGYYQSGLVIYSMAKNLSGTQISHAEAYRQAMRDLLNAYTQLNDVIENPEKWIPDTNALLKTIKQLTRKGPPACEVRMTLDPASWGWE